nr:MAG TPA: hypothetical protein [Caudoviricetes sp.]
MILKYFLRFFLSEDNECFIKFEYDSPPPVPRIGEEVSFEYADEDNYSCYVVKSINYNYPQLDEDENLIDDYMLIDIIVVKEALQ